MSVTEENKNCPLESGLRPDQCDLPRCPECGYTAHDAAFEMDHNACPGRIPDDAATVPERFTVSAEHHGRCVWHIEDRGPMKLIEKTARFTSPATYQSLYECTKCGRRALFGLDANSRIAFEEVLTPEAIQEKRER